MGTGIEADDRGIHLVAVILAGADLAQRIVVPVRPFRAVACVAVSARQQVVAAVVALRREAGRARTVVVVDLDTGRRRRCRHRGTGRRHSDDGGQARKPWYSPRSGHPRPPHPCADRVLPRRTESCVQIVIAGSDCDLYADSNRPDASLTPRKVTHDQGKANGVLAIFLSDVLALEACNLNFSPYLGPHVARRSMAAVPAEAPRAQVGFLPRRSPGEGPDGSLLRDRAHLV